MCKTDACRVVMSKTDACRVVMCKTDFVELLCAKQTLKSCYVQNRRV